MRKLSDILRERDRPDHRDLTSRSDLKRERRQVEERLAELAQSLVALSDQRLSALELPEAVLDSVRDAKRITSAAAHNRQLRIVRRELRGIDFESIERKLPSHTPPRKKRHARR